MAITRRDFLNGVAVTVAAGLTPLEWVRAAGKRIYRWKLLSACADGAAGQSSGIV